MNVKDLQSSIVRQCIAHCGPLGTYSESNVATLKLFPSVRRNRPFPTAQAEENQYSCTWRCVPVEALTLLHSYNTATITLNWPFVEEFLIIFTFAVTGVPVEKHRLDKVTGNFHLFETCIDS